MRWNEADTLKFVRIYLKHECLWNPDHYDYRVKHVRTKAIFEIIAEFKAATSIKLCIPEVKLKIKSLRSTYMIVVNKILQKSMLGVTYKPSLVWFHEMDRCLKRVPIIRHLSGDIRETTEFDSSSYLDYQPNESNPDPLSPHGEDTYSSQEESNIKHECLPLPPLHMKNKKRKYILRNTAYIKQTSYDSGSREDEFDIYGKYIASQLRSMELQTALNFQLEIQSLIIRARMSDIDLLE